MDEDETKAAIAYSYESEKYLIDPHTAVGYGCAKKYREESGDNTPVILASTASPYKFAPAVCESIGLPENKDIFACLNELSAATGTEIPAPLANTLGMEVRFTEVLDPADMPSVPFRV